MTMNALERIQGFRDEWPFAAPICGPTADGCTKSMCYTAISPKRHAVMHCERGRSLRRVASCIVEHAY